MASILHGNAKTTPRIRAEIQNANKSITELAKRYHLTLKTVSKWKNATTVKDSLSRGNRSSRSLSQEQEQMICEARRITQFALDDILILLKPHMKALTRSNLYRTLRRHHLDVLTKEKNKNVHTKSRFKDYPIGYVHIDISCLMVNKSFTCLLLLIEFVSMPILKYIIGKQYHDDNEIELRQHAQAFMLLYNYQKPLKSYGLKHLIS